MQPQTFSITLAASSANNICKSQSGTKNVALTLNGTTVNADNVAVLDVPRRIAIHCVGDESSNTFTIVGYASTTGTSMMLTEALKGATAGNDAYTSLDLGQVIKITPSANTAAAVTVGTNGVGSTPWINPTFNYGPQQIHIETMVTGTVNYTIQTTMDSFWTVGVPTSTIPVTKDTTIASVTTDQIFDLTWPVAGWRVLINSGTGTVAVSAIQAGIMNG